MTGGITPHALEKSSPTYIDVDFAPEVSDNLFRTEGNIVLWSNASLPYLTIDAILCNKSLKIDDIKYIMMDLEPSRSQHFEISKNRKLSLGTYNCTLEISGPEGLIESKTRSCLGSFEAQNEGQEVQYIFVSQGEKEPHIISDDSLKGYLARQGPSNNLTSAQGFSPNPQSSLSNVLNGSRNVDGSLVGSITSKKYHLPNCSYALKIKPENKIYFADAEEAQRQGYQPCKVCNP